MTSISSGTSFAARLSPGDRMRQQLSSAVSSGTVKAADQTALASALTDIDTAMKAGAGSSPASTGGKHVHGKEKIDTLIAQEVKDGKLTDDQATELKQLFANAAPKMGGAGAPPPPPPPTQSSDSDATSSLIDSLTATSATAGTSAAASSADPVTALMDFLKTLRSATADKTVYGANGASTDTSLKSLLVDTQA